MEMRKKKDDYEKRLAKATHVVFAKGPNEMKAACFPEVIANEWVSKLNGFQTISNYVFRRYVSLA